MGKTSRILREVERYYAGKLRLHGATPRGVDWNSAESQELRLAQVAKVIDLPHDAAFSLLDYGCGFGAGYGFLRDRFPNLRFEGFDISQTMIAKAAELYPDARWTSTRPAGTFDFVLASGIFNVKLDHSDADWTSYVEETLQHLDALAHRAFAFNMLTSYSDPEHRRDDLFYVDPGAAFAFAQQNFSRHVTLLHDYPLYEFTMIVRKTGED